MTPKLMLSDFDYNLPKELIAQAPAERRDMSRLMVVRRDSGKDAGKDNVEHKHFFDVVDYFREGDVLVVNNTKVLPYKFYGNKETGGRVEIVLGSRITEGIDGKNRNIYECRIKSVKTRNWGKIILVKASEKERTVLISDKAKKRKRFNVHQNAKDTLSCRVLQKIDDKYIIEFDDDKFSEAALREFGELPLPPYIKGYKGDFSRYQTVFSRNEGSIAAPTAGLHFTEELLDKLRKKGVKIATVCLHVSFGTFNPVKTENIAEHKMEPEYFIVSKETADTINDRKGRLFVTGTTTLKTLETVADGNGKIHAKEGWSNLFIYPGYMFKVHVYGFITNFHLPKSTLMLLVSAFWGREEILDAYKTAVDERYRFFSFGDAMLLMR